MPPITAWMVLTMLVFWDLFAVLNPYGPLRCIIELIRAREARNEPTMSQLPPIMVYSTMAYLIMAEGSSVRTEKTYEQQQSTATGITNSTSASTLSSACREDAKMKSRSNYKKQKNKFRPQLGLGDFIFYSLLIGKSWIFYQQILTVIFVIISILMGLFLTLLLLVIKNHALPALPISLTFGLIIGFTSHFMVEPFCNALNVHMIHI